MSPIARRRARYLVPLGAAAITAAIVFVPQAASGEQHPNLPAKSAAQLLASLEQLKLPQFSGTVVETARLGLPDIGDSALGSEVAPGGGKTGIEQLVTLLTGSHTAQLAYGGPDKQRVAIFLSDLSETDVVHNGTNLWTYSSDSNTVSHKTVARDSEDTAPQATTPLNPTKEAEQALAKINPSTKVTVDRTAEVAGRPAYQLDLDPRDSRALISSVRIAMDSQTSMPLRVQIWSRKNTSSPAFSVGFTSIAMSAPSASTFDFTKPPSASMQSSPFSGEGLGAISHGAAQRAYAQPTIGKDWTVVYVDRGSVGTSSSARSVRSSVTRSGVFGSKSKSVGVEGSGGGPGLAQELDQLGSRVPEGHLITTSLVTILVTNDNRILFGAVTPQYLEQVAASQAAQ